MKFTTTTNNCTYFISITYTNFSHARLICSKKNIKSRYKFRYKKKGKLCQITSASQYSVRNYNYYYGQGGTGSASFLGGPLKRLVN